MADVYITGGGTPVANNPNSVVGGQTNVLPPPPPPAAPPIVNNPDVSDVVVQASVPVGNDKEVVLEGSGTPVENASEIDATADIQT